MRNYNLLSGAFLVIVSVVVCTKAFRLGLGNSASPGPGFIPFAIAALLGGMSLYLCLRGVTQMLNGYREKEAFKKTGWGKALLVVILLGAYGGFFNVLGFPSATLMLMMSLLLLPGGQNLRLSLAVSLLTVACSYVLFVILFGLPLPRGSLWYFLGE